jgi:hypothetical protein
LRNSARGRRREGTTWCSCFSSSHLLRSRSGASSGPGMTPTRTG